MEVAAGRQCMSVALQSQCSERRPMCHVYRNVEDGCAYDVYRIACPSVAIENTLAEEVKCVICPISEPGLKMKRLSLAPVGERIGYRVCCRTDRIREQVLISF